MKTDSMPLLMFRIFPPQWGQITTLGASSLAVINVESLAPLSACRTVLVKLGPVKVDADNERELVGVERPCCC